MKGENKMKIEYDGKIITRTEPIRVSELIEGNKYEYQAARSTIVFVN